MSCRARMTALLTLLATASAAGAQETALQFGFSNPGARSLGFGGAFVALADDATAAFANPAGLVQLTRPEVSIEGRLWDDSTSFTTGGRLTGEPTGTGIDDTAGLRFDTSPSTQASLSFLSFVYPKGRWSFAFYRHQLANFAPRSATDGLFVSSFDGSTLRANDLRINSSLEVLSWGVAGGVRISESFNLGLGVNYHDGRLDSTDELYTFPPGGLFLPNPYRPEDQIVVLRGMIDDSAWTISAGFLWRINRQWSLGGVYRPGPAFSTEQVLLAGPAFFGPEGTVLVSRALEVNLPDVYGLGLAFRTPNEALTVSVEWDEVEYSDIVESIPDGSGGIVELVQDDGEEFHVGLEYVFLRSKPLVAIRFGTWEEPDHRFRIEGPGTGGRDPTEEIGITALQAPGQVEDHGAVGIGLAFDRYQIDFGADFSDEVNTFSLSAIYAF